MSPELRGILLDPWHGEVGVEASAPQTGKMLPATEDSALGQASQELFSEPRDLLGRLPGSAASQHRFRCGRRNVEHRSEIHVQGKRGHFPARQSSQLSRHPGSDSFAS